MLSNFPIVKQGAIIDVVAPASGVPRDQILTQIKQVKKLIEDMGFVPRISSNIMIADADPYSANRANFRAKDLIRALVAEDSDCVWCIRGGYGCANLISDLDNIKPPKKVKLLLGFSDITVLHIYLNRKWNWPSLHAKVLFQLATKQIEDEINLLKNIITGKKDILTYNLKPLNNRAQNVTKINASVVGGNMSLIQSSIGTKWQIDTKNKILLLEEVNERGYQIDRMLNHFDQAHLLKEAKAVIIGDIICKKEPNGLELCNEAVSRFLLKANVPVFRIYDVGHGPINHPIPLNYSNTVIINNKIEFSF